MQALRKAGRPLRLDELQAMLGPAAAAQVEGTWPPASCCVATWCRTVAVSIACANSCPVSSSATVSAHRNGDGWLMPDDAAASVYLPSQQLREVMHGDRVAVRVEGPGFRGRPQGVIVEVLERRMREVVGRLYVEAGVAYVVARQPAHHSPRARAARAHSAAPRRARS